MSPHPSTSWLISTSLEATSLERMLCFGLSDTKRLISSVLTVLRELMQIQNRSGVSTVLPHTSVSPSFTNLLSEFFSTYSLNFDESDTNPVRYTLYPSIKSTAAEGSMPPSRSPAIIFSIPDYLWFQEQRQAPSRAPTSDPLTLQPAFSSIACIFITMTADASAGTVSKSPLMSPRFAGRTSRCNHQRHNSDAIYKSFEYFHNKSIWRQI